MPRASVTAKNYSKALFAAAVKGNILDKVLDDLEKFRENFSINFASELKNPAISKADSANIISEVAKKFNLGTLSTSFFAAIVKNRRLNLFPEIYEDFFRLVKQKKNILEVELVTAIKPESTQLERIKALVAKKYPGKTISVKETITAKILGGLQIKVGSEVIDVSLKSQLDKFDKELLSAVN